MELPVIRRCEYRNCNKIVEGKKNKKFCSKSCRSQEAVYEMRDKKKIKKEKNHINDMMKYFKEGFSQENYELYKIIFEKK